MTEHKHEEETRTGKVRAFVGHYGGPYFTVEFEHNSKLGAYTATLINGEVQEIHWRKTDD
jgi:hypothetical protein